MRLKKTIIRESNNDNIEIINFLEDLPHLLKVEISVHINEKKYNRINFLKG